MKEKRTYRPQGNVNFGIKKSVFHRTLKNISTGELFETYTYYNDKNWFGYLINEMKNVPCNHCGQINIFDKEKWTHECPAIWNDVELPCKLPHTCNNLPSFSWHGCNIFYSTIYEEI